MEFRVLGSVEAVVSGRSVHRVRRREWLLLGVLLLEAGRHVSINRLIHLLWSEEPPQNPRQTLQVYVSRLRNQLGPAGSLLRFASDGYRLDVDSDTIDAHRFAGQVEKARKVPDPAERSRLLRDALGLWRGPLMSGVAGDDVRERLGGVWEELRLTALEDRIDADLACGQDTALLPELTELVRLHPMRETFVAACITVLHRSGRTGEAVEFYQDCVHRLRADYGLDVGDELRERYVAVLRQDPALRTEPTASAPAELPVDLAVFVGRDEELALLCGASEDAPGRAAVAVVDGMPGVGKTALAVHAAHRIRDRYPDGQLYLDLRGFNPDMAPVRPADALDRMMRSLGLTGEGIPQSLGRREAEYRSAIAGRRVLILLDNAVDAEQVRQLIPASPGCLVLITSRHRLVEVDADVRLTLSPLGDEESRRLFRQIAETDVDNESVTAIARRCGRLPLALRVAAARLNTSPHWTPGRLLEHLSGDGRGDGADEVTSAVMTAVRLSYRHLGADAAEMLRLLALAPVDVFDVLTAAALSDVSVQRAEELLAELFDARMIESDGPRGYRFHDLVRRFAGRVLATDTPADRRRDAVRRLMNHCLATANAAAYRLNPGRVTIADHAGCPNPVPDPGDYESGLRSFDDNRGLLIRMVEVGHEYGMHDLVWRLCSMLTMYLQLRHHYDAWRMTHELGLDSAEKLDDVHARARMAHRLAGLYQAVKDIDRAVDGLVAAERLYADTTDLIGWAATCNSLGATYLDAPASHRDMAKGITHLERALKLYRRANDRTGQAMATTNLGRAHRMKGSADVAVRQLDEALKLFGELGRTGGEAVALHQLGLVHSDGGRDRRAMDCYRRAIELARRSGSIGTLTDLLTDMGEVCRRLGRLRQAETYHDELASILESGGHQHATDDLRRMHAAIAATYRAIGRRADTEEEAVSAKPTESL